MTSADDLPPLLPVSRRTVLSGALGVGSLIGLAGLTGCSDDEQTTEPQPRTSPAATTTTGTTTRPAPTTKSPTPTPTASPTGDERPRWPLTGQLLSDPSSPNSTAHHAAVAVKVPDNEWEHPQRGINDADIVFVELEGYRDSAGYSSTRLVPVFHSRMAANVAPVRSIRPVDVPLLSPIDALIGNTGGSRWVIRYVRHYRAHLEGMLSYLDTVGTGSYSTDGSRVYSQNGHTYYDRAIVCHPAVLARQTGRFRSGPPLRYFPIATGDQVVSTDQGKPGRALTVPYKGDHYRMGYRYDSGSKRYLRSVPWGPHVLADGERVSTDNVLVIKAHQHFGKIFRGGGHAEPLHDIIEAKGEFLYFHGGRYVTGTWSKGFIRQRFVFLLDNGEMLRMAPGRTFVELPDTNARIHIRG